MPNEGVLSWSVLNPDLTTAVGIKLRNSVLTSNWNKVTKKDVGCKNPGIFVAAACWGLPNL